ncbi:response regulator [Aquimarina intermedia]|uniref:Response regulator receiver domain-containing protein n=1 Tax=Aquimarina intermedia TaxID=350814 RepID=A0A5S5BW78_9FLAO|nr:response regulator [Aquimarina intermedia]TYP70442.1 response regulator receiver domain-containing protein [Aquimarina intermedia]
MTNKNLSLCLVDDDIIHQFIIKKLVQQLHQQERLLIFSNGEEAINFIKSVSNGVVKLPDLILLDLNMPIMDGWQFMDEFNSIAPDLKKDIKIYILSSSDNPDDIERAKEYERISDYLIKPINEQQLKELIETF